MTVSEGPWIAAIVALWGTMAGFVAVVLAQGVPGGEIGGVPWAVLLGPYGLTAYLLWDNWQIRKERNSLQTESKDLLVKYREWDEEERRWRQETERRQETEWRRQEGTR